MPATIVSDMGPASYLNLTEDEVKQCTPELETYFKPAVSRREQFEGGKGQQCA